MAGASPTIAGFGHTAGYAARIPHNGPQGWLVRPTARWAYTMLIEAPWVSRIVAMEPAIRDAFHRMSRVDRIRLLQDLWEEVADDVQSLEVPDWQKKVLDE